MSGQIHDLVVVGSGIAGWCAAVRARQLNLDVAIIDRSEAAPGWNNSRISGGVFQAAHLDPTRSAQEIYSETLKLTDGNARLDLATAYATNCGRAVSWLKEHGGAEFARRGDHEYRNYVLVPERPASVGVLWKDYGPDRLLTFLFESFRRSGGKYHYGTRAAKIRPNQGSGWRVTAESADGRELSVDGSAVLLADGGFQASDELLRRYVGTTLDRLALRGVDTSVGDCLRMGLDAGAAVANMEWFYGRCLSRDALRLPDLSLYPMLDDVIRAGVVVDPGGRRLADEWLGEVVMANAIAKSETAMAIWLILDHELWVDAGRKGRIPPNPAILDAGGTVLSADTIGALAQLAAVDPVGLKSTLESYNAHCQAQSDGFLPGRTGAPKALVRPPFHAVPIMASISFTMGGLLANQHAQVLDVDGHPIEALYAAGGTMGGLQGGPRGGYLGGLLDAGVFGLLAAEHVRAALAAVRR
jgi:fumarate reductase flavoprotein subunit